MSSKICTKCSRELPATTEFFSPNPTGKFGLYSICRKCKQPIDCERRKTRDKKKELEQKKEYYYKDRDRLNSLAKLHNHIRKIKIKQQTCTICNEQKKLQLASIDHAYTESPEDYMWLCQSCHHLYDSSRGGKGSVQKRIEDDSFVDKPESIRLSSNGKSIVLDNEGMPSTVPKPSEPSPCCEDCMKRNEMIEYCNIYTRKCPYYRPKEKAKSDYITKSTEGQATTGTKEVLYPGIYDYIKTEPEKGDSYCVGALLDGIHDYWEVYDLTTDTGRLGFAEELMGVLKVFYFEDFKERVRKELIEEFLLDFQWYLAFITHFQWTKACSCKTNPIRFEKWMIKKWRGKLKQ